MKGISIMSNKPEEYTMIAAWCRYMGSNASYTVSEMRLASKQNAPLDAIYPSGDGIWKTVRDLPTEHNFVRWINNVTSPFTGKTS